ncbi:major facilitator superfamily domain-containing protein [Zalerion maritima]|uniref:Major facilitator superfamily domain-containing protein n=1 Tax=Zalerion maritima TaxID=339359 RepID=A0AAD5RQP6_9PEZI|nr:major facilitator superfamily domain-containing protein [Zalerion maritima]
MAWGILESRSHSHVPGTVLLDSSEDPSAEHLAHLKRTTHRGKSIILVPQPSEDPNDPLNWSLWAKDLLTLLYGYCTLLIVGGIGPILSALTLELVTLFDVSYTDVSLLTGYSLCATAASGIFISAVSHKYGRRIPMLFSLACAFSSTVWGGYAESYGSLLGARILQGLSCSMFESVIFSLIGDMYFVHERGIRIAVMSSCFAGISNLPSLLAGKIATDLGWRWVFWLLAIFLGVALVLSIPFGWETSYNRQDIYNTDLASQDNLEDLDAKQTAGEIEMAENKTSGIESGVQPPARKSFLQMMNPYSGTYTNESIWRLLMDPFLILANPAVIWAVLLMSFPTLWLVAVNLLVAQIFSGPPYSLTTAELGYLAAGPTVGGLLGSILAGLSSDPVIKWAAKKNHGIYEPEFRLLLIVPAVVTSSMAYFLFGNLIEAGKSAAAMAVIWGIAVFSLQFVIMVVGSYGVDAYRDISVEIFMATMIFKNFLFFGFSYFLNSWIVSWGPAKMFDCVAAIQIGLCLTTIPIWMYGKRLRGWWHNVYTVPTHKHD